MEEICQYLLLVTHIDTRAILMDHYITLNRYFAHFHKCTLIKTPNTHFERCCTWNFWPCFLIAAHKTWQKIATISIFWWSLQENLSQNTFKRKTLRFSILWLYLNIFYCCHIQFKWQLFDYLGKLFRKKNSLENLVILASLRETSHYLEKTKAW